MRGCKIKNSVVHVYHYGSDRETTGIMLKVILVLIESADINFQRFYSAGDTYGVGE